MKKKILYIVSNLSKSGPTNQLFNVLKFIDKNIFDITILTLSPEPETNSRKNDFSNLNVEIISLNLSRLEGFFLGRILVSKKIKRISPNFIHSQGVRADTIVALIKPTIPWIITSHNFPPEDYISQYGSIVGNLMVKMQFFAMRRCRNVVSCSKTIKNKLLSQGIKSFAIQNGVSKPSISHKEKSFLETTKRPIFISVGALIPRKNMEYLIQGFVKSDKQKRGSLLILGDGIKMESLFAKYGNDIHFLGNVNNVGDYLNISDYFISSSLSEGLPNSVLEALSFGMPAILSNIDSHQEISVDFPLDTQIFNFENDHKTLINIFENSSSLFQPNSDRIKKKMKNKFSSESMSDQYQQYYLSLEEQS